MAEPTFLDKVAAVRDALGLDANPPAVVLRQAMELMGVQMKEGLSAAPLSRRSVVAS